MCLSTVYKKSAEESNVLLRNVQKIVVRGDTLILTDLLETETSIKGQLVMADLVNGCVIVDTAE